MIIIATRPTEMAKNDGDVYYPAGIPSESSPKTGHWEEYKDLDLRSFWICYTQKQVEEEVKTRGFFSPFIPFMQPLYQIKKRAHDL
jgi:hypothetical protein